MTMTECPKIITCATIATVAFVVLAIKAHQTKPDKRIYTEDALDRIIVTIKENER